MSKKYKNRIKLLQSLQILLFIICILAFIFYLYKITRPEITLYIIKDECGPIGGSISHSIGDEDTCYNRCNADCISLKKEISSSQIILKQTECNICNCYCKG
jgi:hypothetical protein